MVCIKVQNYVNDEIKELKQKIKNNVDNPKLVIEKININKKIINIVQDGHLIAGTKQRVAKLFIKKIIKKNPQIKNLVYSGALRGYGQIATAYAAYKLNLNSHVFLSKKIDSNEKINNIKKIRQVKTLNALNANIYICDTYNNAKQNKYKLTNDNQHKLKKDFYIVPMGLNDVKGVMINLLSKQIKKATKNTSIETMKKRIWLVSGSGGIAMSIKKAYPDCELFILLKSTSKYSKRIIEWAKNEKNVHIIKNEKLIKKKNNYSFVKNYNDLIVPYIEKYAQNNDIIWNVSSDDIELLKNIKE